MHLSARRPYSSWTDAELQAALPADDQQAFAELYHRYCYRLFGVAYHKLKSREAAEELVQDLFEHLWHKRATVAMRQVEQYLFAALSHRIINYVKSQQVRAGYEAFCRMRRAEADLNTENTIAWRDLGAALARALQRLPEKSRQVFQLSRLEQYPVADIAAQVNMSEKMVEYHLTKSLKKLRGYLREFLPMLLALLLPWQ